MNVEARKGASELKSVGVYADFLTVDSVKRAMAAGWNGIASTGALGTREVPYTQELSWQPDRLIARALESVEGVWWLSFWTVSWPLDGRFGEGGFLSGRRAAETILSHHEKRWPTYVILDPEGYHRPASSAVEWRDWLVGFGAGVKSVSKALQPGFYCNQSQYATFHLQTVPLPAFIAVSPITGNHPAVKGGNVEGYIAYYALDPLDDQLRTVAAWGGRFNTVQFHGSAVDCGPSGLRAT